MGKFRKKPVVIEAVLYSGDNKDAIRAFIGSDLAGSGFDLFIMTPEGVMTLSPGSWLIRGVAGEYYPCLPHIFDATYEEVTDA